MPAQDDKYALKPYISVSVQCVGEFGLGQKSGQSLVRFGSTVTSAAAIAGGPVHTRDCEPYAQFSTGDLNAYSADAWNVVRTVGVSLYLRRDVQGHRGLTSATACSPRPFRPNGRIRTAARDLRAAGPRRDAELKAEISRVRPTSASTVPARSGAS